MSQLNYPIFNTRYHDTNYNKDEELTSSRGASNPTYIARDLFRTNLIRTGPSKEIEIRRKPKTTRHLDYFASRVLSGHSEAALHDSIPIANGQSCNAIEEDAASASSNVFDAQTPVSFGPSGSGYKGNDKSHQEYTTTSGMYDYQGSYSQSSHKQSRGLSEGSDSDKPSESPGGGGGPGSGGGLSGEGVVAKLKQKKKKVLQYGGGYYRKFRYQWTCVSFNSAHCPWGVFFRSNSK